MRSVQALMLAIAVLTLSLVSMRTEAQSALSEDGSAGSVILVLNLDTTNNGRAIWMGTGFVISEDGLAITNSHIVYPALHDSKYVLAAVVGKEMYSIEVLCASSLDHNPLKEHPLQYHRDIARIRLQPWAGPGETWSWVKGDPDMTYMLHREELPRFHPLTIETSTPSGRVHSIGYGKVSAYPRLHRSEGTIADTGSLSDGTPYLKLEMTRPAQHGDSGSPILDDQNRVVGIFTWGSDSDGRVRWAQGAAATRSCGR